MSKKELFILLVLAFALAILGNLFPEVGWILVLSLMILGPLALVFMFITGLFRKKKKENDKV